MVAQPVDCMEMWSKLRLLVMYMHFDRNQQWRGYFIYICSRRSCQLASCNVLFGSVSSAQISAVSSSYRWAASSWVARVIETHTGKKRKHVRLLTSTQSVHVPMLVYLYAVHNAQSHTCTQCGINRSKGGMLEAQTQLVSLLWWMSGSQMDQGLEIRKRG